MRAALLLQLHSLPKPVDGAARDAVGDVVFVLPYGDGDEGADSELRKSWFYSTKLNRFYMSIYTLDLLTVAVNTSGFHSVDGFGAPPNCCCCSSGSTRMMLARREACPNEPPLPPRLVCWLPVDEPALCRWNRRLAGVRMAAGCWLGGGRAYMTDYLITQ